MYNNFETTLLKKNNNYNSRIRPPKILPDSYIDSRIWMLFIIYNRHSSAATIILTGPVTNFAFSSCLAESFLQKVMDRSIFLLICVHVIWWIIQLLACMYISKSLMNPPGVMISVLKRACDACNSLVVNHIFQDRRVRKSFML